MVLGSYAVCAADPYIQFNPALPSSVCSGEKVDVTVKGRASYSPTYPEQVECNLGTNDHINVYYCLDVKEADTWSGDDDIGHNCEWVKSYTPCNEFTFQHTFYNVDFNTEFGGLEDTGTIEVYAKVYDDGEDDGSG